VARKIKEEEMTEEQRRRAKENALTTKRFYLLIVMLLLIVALVVSSIVLWIITPRPESNTPPSTEGNMFAVETITLEGNTKYLEESVIGESGVLIGQSIFKVKSNAVEEHLLNTFPYYADVDVQTLRMKEVRITVTETDCIGVMYADGHWIPIGGNGKVLDKQPITSDRPKNSLYIKAKAPKDGISVGAQALDEYEASVLGTLLSAINRYALSDVTEINITDMTDIRLVWRSQIEVWLGNTSNLEHEIGVVAATIPKILQSRGEQASGRLNLVSYSSDEAVDKQAVFTPSSLLPTKPTAPRQPAPGEILDTPEEDESEEDSDTPSEEDSEYEEEDSYYEEDPYYEEEDSDYTEEDSYYEEESDYEGDSGE